MPRKLNEQKYCSWCGAEVAFKSEWMSACNGCGFKNYLNPKPCINAIITRDDKAMILKRTIDPGNGKFNVLGGFVDLSDESLEAATYREIEEETGITRSELSPLRYFASQECHQYIWQNSFVPCMCVYFVMELSQNKEISVGKSENSQIRWVRKDDLNDIDFAFAVDKQMLIKYFSEGL